MNLEEIEKEFNELARNRNVFIDDPNGGFIIANDKIKQFYRSKFTELLESLRVEEIDIDETGEYKTDLANKLARNGYNSCVEKVNSRIDNLLK